MAIIIPPIGATGSFRIAAPFDNLLSPNDEYQVTAVRLLSELIDGGEDPVNTIYVNAGLTLADMKMDIVEEIPVIVFLSTAKKYSYIPARYILTMPNVIGNRYQERVMAISLGSIPVELDLTIVKDSVKNIIFDMLGLNIVVEEVEASAVKLVSDADDALFNTTRTNRITVRESYRTQLVKEQAKNAALLTKLANLECYIKGQGNCA